MRWQGYTIKQKHAVKQYFISFEYKRKLERGRRTEDKDYLLVKACGVSRLLIRIIAQDGLQRPAQNTHRSIYILNSRLKYFP